MLQEITHKDKIPFISSIINSTIIEIPCINNIASQSLLKESSLLCFAHVESKDTIAPIQNATK